MNDVAIPDGDELFKAFASALVAFRGNRSQAARAIGYKTGFAAKSAGHRLARHPKVLEELNATAYSDLKALVPQAVRELGALTRAKSPFIRLEASKDILNRNGVGVSDASRSPAPISIRINLSRERVQVGVMQTLDGATSSNETLTEGQGVEKSRASPILSSSPNDFFSEASAGSQVIALKSESAYELED